VTTTHKNQPVAWAAVAAVAGFIVLAAFQAALALGAPLGRAAWGGTHSQLPPGLRIASTLDVALWILATGVILRRGGFRVRRISPAVARWGTWVLVAILPLSALMNFASSSPWERYLWGPLALAMAVLCLRLTRRPAPLP
jgi:hypothetical protein